MADVAVCIPSDNTQHIQEAHLAVEHIICHLVERALFGDYGTDELIKNGPESPSASMPRTSNVSRELRGL
jgi:hypothetical protein